jgi:hypothetical protein
MNAEDADWLAVDTNRRRKNRLYASRSDSTAKGRKQRVIGRIAHRHRLVLGQYRLQERIVHRLDLVQHRRAVGTTAGDILVGYRHHLGQRARKQCEPTATHRKRHTHLIDD